MSVGTIPSEGLATTSAFVAQTLAEHPDRALSAAALIATLRDVERVEGTVLDGAAVELGRRLARVNGLPTPSFPCEFHAGFAQVSDRGLALWALWQAQRLDALAQPQLSREALFLVLGAAKLLAADPLIVPPTATMERLLDGLNEPTRIGAAGGEGNTNLE
ncbi:hypothetical protein JMJ55_29940 [Belnapia sp. T6]|uniref:Uncharacterized protein n=1 Tax=Belnapia mucosa TaxID=2804532 RepID=A0ABS1VGH9_9PROT|nr:hypothetical protein [Belnapia mucosa]MBL6459533.1 hypothetical protein [Belnapia mucosa]